MLDRLLASAFAAGVAEVATLPIDVAKTRLQLQVHRPTGGPRYKGMVDTITRIRIEEGLPALWKGVEAALIRQVCYSALTLGMYEPILTLLSPDAPPTYAARLLSGGLAGALAIVCFNPMEVIKTQQQSSRESEVRLRGVIRDVFERDGPRRLWAGLAPNVTRSFLVNAAELGSYDHARSLAGGIFVGGVGGGVGGGGALAALCVDAGASACAALASAFVSTPIDVLKTRLMQQAGSVLQPYRGMVDAGRRLLRDEGVSAFTKVDSRHTRFSLDDSICHPCPAHGTPPITLTRNPRVTPPIPHKPTHKPTSQLISPLISQLISPLITSLITALLPPSQGFVPVLCRKLLWCFVFFLCYERFRRTLTALFLQSSGETMLIPSAVFDS